MDFKKLNNDIRALDPKAMADAARRWDDIAKPVGSLGRLESLLTRIAGMTRSADVRPDKRAVVVMCADNGVLAQGVAQTPGEITAVMAGFIAQHRSSVCLMARQAHADVFTVDIGMASRIESDFIMDRHIADGTADMTVCPAMTAEQAEKAILTGIELAKSLKDANYNIIATGEMGIGNTTTSSAVASVLLGKAPEDMTGRGAGLSDEGLMRKINAINKAIAVNVPDPNDAFDVLRKLGGYDIAGLCGVFIGGALYGVPVIIDGFISAVSALVAARLCPAAREYMIASHMSAEPADVLVLEALGMEPIIHADMRLGEGTGAVALLPLIDMAVTVYHGLMTYSDIGM